MVGLGVGHFFKLQPEKRVLIMLFKGGFCLITSSLDSEEN